MLANGLERQSPILLRAIVVMLPVRARFAGLQGVGEAIYEQCKISLCHFHARLPYSLHKVPSLASAPRHPTFPNGPPDKRRMCRPRDEVVLRDKFVELCCSEAVVASFVEDHKVEDLQLAVV